MENDSFNLPVTPTTIKTADGKTVNGANHVFIRQDSVQTGLSAQDQAQAEMPMGGPIACDVCPRQPVQNEGGVFSMGEAIADATPYAPDNRMSFAQGPDSRTFSFALFSSLKILRFRLGTFAAIIAINAALFIALQIFGAVAIGAAIASMFKSFSPVALAGIAVVFILPLFVSFLMNGAISKIAAAAYKGLRKPLGEVFGETVKSTFRVLRLMIRIFFYSGIWMLIFLQVAMLLLNVYVFTMKFDSSGNTAYAPAAYAREFPGRLVAKVARTPRVVNEPVQENPTMETTLIDMPVDTENTDQPTINPIQETTDGTASYTIQENEAEIFPLSGETVLSDISGQSEGSTQDSMEIGTQGSEESDGEISYELPAPDNLREILNAKTAVPEGSVGLVMTIGNLILGLLAMIVMIVASIRFVRASLSFHYLMADSEIKSTDALEMSIASTQGKFWMLTVYNMAFGVVTSLPFILIAAGGALLPNSGGVVFLLSLIGIAALFVSMSLGGIFQQFLAQEWMYKFNYRLSIPMKILVALLILAPLLVIVAMGLPFLPVLMGMLR